MLHGISIVSVLVYYFMSLFIYAICKLLVNKYLTLITVKNEIIVVRKTASLYLNFREINLFMYILIIIFTI